MSRGRPRHQSSRRRMYSPRQRDVRERRIHERSDEGQLTDQLSAVNTEDESDHEQASTWGLRLSARPSAA